MHAKKARSGPRKQPSQARSRATVDAILDATARVLVGNGYAKTTTNAVAEVAGISVGSLYQYFPHKNALVAALHERHARQILATFEQVLVAPGQRRLAQTVTELIDAMVDAHRVEPDLHRVLEAEVPHLDEFDGHAEIHGGMRERLLQLLRRHRDEVKVKNLEVAAYVVGEITHVLIHSAVLGPGELMTDAETRRQTARAVIAYLTAPPTPMTLAAGRRGASR